jgi:Acetoacetate decarboxylase (ADC)
VGRQQLLARGLVVAGAGAIVAGIARNASRGRQTDFYDLPLEHSEPKRYGAAYGGMPLVFHRTENIEAFFTADLEMVRAALPTTDLHPVTLPGGRAILLVAAFQYEDVTAEGVDGCAAPPYGEVMVAVPVTRRRAPPFVPLVAPPRSPIEAGGFVLHLPVTTRVARDGGRLIWGFPKFVADMEFSDSAGERSVQVSEGGHEILRFTARPTGRPSAVRESTMLYSVLGTDLIETRVPAIGIRQLRWGRRGGSLELGEHQVADELRNLGIAGAPFITARYVAQRAAMSFGKRIGSASPYLGYIGEDRDLGTYVVKYPNARPIDRYAPFAATAGSVVATASAGARADEAADEPATPQPV